MRAECDGFLTKLNDEELVENFGCIIGKLKNAHFNRIRSLIINTYIYNNNVLYGKLLYSISLHEKIEVFFCARIWIYFQIELILILICVV
jgi:folate-dependent tRNA-U54 methylase TrmFO/GidA